MTAPRIEMLVDEQRSHPSFLVGPYCVRYAPVGRTTLIAVTRRGQVIHRAADFAAGIRWARQRALDIQRGECRKRGADHETTFTEEMA